MDNRRHGTILVPPRTKLDAPVVVEVPPDSIVCARFECQEAEGDANAPRATIASSLVVNGKVVESRPTERHAHSYWYHRDRASKHPSRVKNEKLWLSLDNTKSWLTSVTVSFECELLRRFGEELVLETPSYPLVLLFQGEQETPSPAFVDIEEACQVLRIPRLEATQGQIGLDTGCRVISVRSPVAQRDAWWAAERQLVVPQDARRSLESLRAFLAQHLSYDPASLYTCTPTWKVNKDPKRVKVVLGCMGFADPMSEAESREALELFNATGARANETYIEIDTARMYAKGDSEILIGRILSANPALKDRAFVSTKANPFPGQGERLTRQSLVAQMKASKTALGNNKPTRSLHIFYLHSPDYSTPIHETLACVDEMHKQGLFREFGLSNYPAWMVTLIYHTCAENGWILPTVYQGPYSVLTRDVEKELIPCLRALRIRFYAYNVLCGGLLSRDEPWVWESPPEVGRFKSGPQGEKYRKRLWKQGILRGVQELQDATKECEEALGTPCSTRDFSLRWLIHHSMLRGDCGDAVLVGASKPIQLRANLESLDKGEPLPYTWVRQSRLAWEEWAKVDCAPYSR